VWLFTDIGFYSVVAVDETHNAPWGIAEPGTRMMIRARDALHLLELAERYFPDATIYQTPQADYQYRIVVDKDAWAEAAHDLAASIDYPNFKARVDHKTELSITPDPYASALYRVWTVMATSLYDVFPSRFGRTRPFNKEA
jgi:hypothetical protein